MTARRVRGLLGGAWRHTTHSHPHVLRSGLATGRAPHVRMDIDLLRLQRALLTALLPCAAAGVVTTGYQIGSAAAVTGSAIPGWRGDVLGVLGTDPAAGTALAWIANGLVYLLPLLAACAAADYAATWLFARTRHRRSAPGTAATALVFVLLLPASVTPWQAALAMAAGVVLGREVFGGAGRTFVHPAVVGLVLLQVTFPAALRAGVGGVVSGHRAPGELAAAAGGGTDALRDAGLPWWDTFTGLDPGGLGDTSTLACLLGAAFLLYRRAGSWRVMAGALAGVVCASALLANGPSFPGVTWPWHLTLGSLAFVIAFVATDPASGALTNVGRWWHGALVGFLAIVIRVLSPVHVEGAILAALLGSMFVPLIDHAVVRRHVRRRRQRRG